MGVTIEVSARSAAELAGCWAESAVRAVSRFGQEVAGQPSDVFNAPSRTKLSGYSVSQYRLIAEWRSAEGTVADSYAVGPDRLSR